MKLTNTAIRNAKLTAKQYRLADGQGLNLLIHPNGQKYRRRRYRFQGKEKMLSLGVYSTVTLAKARQRCAQAREQLTQGIDPRSC